MPRSSKRHCALGISGRASARSIDVSASVVRVKLAARLALCLDLLAQQRPLHVDLAQRSSFVRRHQPAVADRVGGEDRDETASHAAGIILWLRAFRGGLPMGKVFEGIDEKLAAWIAAQHMFFVATAPREGEHVNLSPKGLDSLAVLGPKRVAYLDVVGSGAETIAHLRENGRITLMFCAFEGLPRIVRLHGRGEAIEPGDPEFAALAAHFPAYLGTRAIIRAELGRIADSCGYGVPLYQFKGERSQIGEWAERKGPEGLRAYQLERNRESLDGLPALRGKTLGA